MGTCRARGASEILKGPHLVVAVHRGIIVAGWFHLTRAAADRRADKCRLLHAGHTVKVDVYSLAELISHYRTAQQREVAELERMSRL